MPWVCVGFVILAATLLALRLQHLHVLKTRLLTTQPDAIADDGELKAFALPRGERGYADHCANCHGLELHGDRRRGVPDLVDKDWLYGSGRVGEIERVVMYGVRSGMSKSLNQAAMPAFATPEPYARYKIDPLSPTDIEAVAALLYSFQHPTAVDPALVARGAAVYHGKGLCFDCHADHAKGDAAIGAPNLTDAIWLYGDGSVKSIRHSIERGLGGVCPTWAARLSPDVIRAIAVYVNAKAQ
jgi:cytochrome c oxidase cbb3-type subunit 3